ncbi:MAG: hypothetical protein J0H34_19155 [Rhizobiales bacterium]|nr:hypothetical protein [Hyphomicrobiales bacterium]
MAARPASRRRSLVDDIFPEQAKKKAAKDRIVAPQAVIDARPDIILASWCGKQVCRKDSCAARLVCDSGGA